MNRARLAWDYPELDTIVDVSMSLNPEVRKQAMYQIGNSDDPASVNALIKIAQEGKDSELQVAAVYALGNAGKDDAVAPLAGIAKTGTSRKLRSAAVNALGQIGTDKARAALVDILQH